MAEVGHLYLSTWLKKADDAYRASRDLLITPFYGGAVPMFLLHWAIELYLKAFLLNNDAFRRGHNLVALFRACEDIDPRIGQIEVTDIKGNGKTLVNFWIRFIDIFGAHDGGVRYLNKYRTSYAFPSNIHNNFDSLIAFIKDNVDGETDITNFC